MLFCRIGVEMLPLHNIFGQMFIDKIIRKVPAGLMTMAIVVTIAYVSLDGDPFDASMIPLFEGADKVIHAIMYFTLVAVLLFDAVKFRKCGKAGKAVTLASVVVAFAYSVLMEYLQDQMGLGRTASVADLVANLAGACLGALFMKCLFLPKMYAILSTEDKNGNKS